MPSCKQTVSRRLGIQYDISFSVAELKAKASGITSAGVEKLQNVRDRNTRCELSRRYSIPLILSLSVPMARTNWDPYSGERPPPPPPPRSVINQNTKPLKPLLPPPSRTASSTASLNRTNSERLASPLPSRPPSSPALPLSRNHSISISPQIDPPHAPLQTKPSSGKTLPDVGHPPSIHRSTRPDLQIHKQTPVELEIDWVNISPEDKEVLFIWLDEFFANFKAKTSVKTDKTAGPNFTSLASHAAPLLAQAVSRNLYIKYILQFMLFRKIWLQKPARKSAVRDSLSVKLFPNLSLSSSDSPEPRRK